MPSVMTTATSYCEVAEAGLYSARSQLVEPSAVALVQLAYVRLKAAASARVETETRPGAFAPPRVAGEYEEKVKRAIDDGVPWSASTKVSAAVFSAGTLPLIDPDRSMINATLSPHRSGSAGLTREDCQVPVDAVRLLPPDPTMNPPGPVAVELYVVTAASRGVWNRYGVVTVPPVRNVSFTNHPSGAATCRTQNCRPSLAPPAAVPVTTNEQSPSASDTQVKAGVPRPGRPRPQHHRYGQDPPGGSAQAPGEFAPHPRQPRLRGEGRDGDYCRMIR